MKTVFTRNIVNHGGSKEFAKELYVEYLQSLTNFSVFFEGELGAGKTYIIREILQLLGVGEEIGSPTYTLVNEYQGNKGKLAHFDFYRLEDSSEFWERGLVDIADDEDISCFVEWPEKLTLEARNHFSGKQFLVRLSHGEERGERQLKLLEI
jgi:tRNA threonylcarbamoyladenosine biosynthesis protein TsaE